MKFKCLQITLGFCFYIFSTNAHAQGISKIPDLLGVSNPLEILEIAAPLMILFVVIHVIYFHYKHEKDEEKRKNDLKLKTLKDKSNSNDNEDKVYQQYQESLIKKIKEKTTIPNKEVTLLDEIKGEKFYLTVKTIFSDIKLLQSYDVIINDVEKKLDLENIETKYLPKIIKNYLSVDKNSRNKTLDNNSSIFEMTNKQINLLKEYISNLKDFALNEQAYKLQVSEKFLETKFNLSNYKEFNFMDSERD